MSTQSTRLTEKQLGFFNVFGFIHFPGLLDDCKDRIIDEFENVWSEHGGGHDGSKHDGKQRSCIVPFPDQSEFLSSLLDDPRIHDIPASILGDDFNYTSGDGNLYASDTQWHSDDFKRTRIPSIKIAFYLDCMTRETGALRVIPGSHHCGDQFSDIVEKKIREPGSIASSEKYWGIQPSEVPAVALETVPGDVVVFWHNLKHGAFGGSERRRMFTMNFCEHVPDHRLAEMQDMLASEGRFFIDRILGPKMLETAGPERMVHLKQVMENDFKVKEYHEHLKAKGMKESSRG